MSVKESLSLITELSQCPARESALVNITCNLPFRGALKFAVKTFSLPLRSPPLSTLIKGTQAWSAYNSSRSRYVSISNNSYKNAQMHRVDAR